MKRKDIQKKVIKIAIIILSAISILVFVTGIYLFVTIRSSLPDWEGEFTTDGIIHPVSIILDEFGVPHIKAVNEQDLFFAIGYSQATERLFQMDTRRRHAAGTLSEIFGKRTIGIDRRMRNLFLKKYAQTELDNADDDMKKLLSSFAAGVNQVITSGPLPVEYRLMKIDPQPWTLLDTILVWYDFSWSLSSTGGELGNSEILSGLGKQWLKILRDLEISEFTAKPADFKTVQWASSRDWDKDAGSNPTGRLIMVSDKSSGDFNLLASDFQMRPEIPTQFYQMHISAPDINFAGMFIAGTPFALAGRNDNSSWASIPSSVDSIDFFELVVNPNNKNQYRDMGSWVDFETINEKFTVRNKPDEMKEYKLCRFGPVITGSKWKNNPLSFKWTGMINSGGSSLKAAYRIIKSSSQVEFVKAIEDWSLPHLTIARNDKSGNSLVTTVGAKPERIGMDGSISIQTDGNTYWNGLESGKYSVIETQKSTYISIGGLEPFFAEKRVNRILGSNKISAELLSNLLIDNYSVEAEELLAHFKDMKLDNPVLQRRLKRLQEWDRKFEDGSAPALYLAFKHNLMWYLLADDIRSVNKRLSNYSRKRVSSSLRALKEDGLNAGWSDKKNTPQIEKLDDIVKQSLASASTYLIKKYSHTWHSKSWNEMHRVYYFHPLGDTTLKKKIFNRGPFGISGGANTLNPTLSSMEFPFAVNRMPVYRIVFDMTNPDNSLVVKNLGQSGNPFSVRYRDEMELYINNGYNKLHFSSNAIRKNMSSKVVLNPNAE